MKLHENYMVNNLINWIEDNLEKKLNVKLVAEKSGYSIDSIQKKFKKITGYTVSEYIRRRRMFKAACYLCFTNKNITLISKKLGYDSLSVFIRAFKKHLLLAPSAYRRNRLLVTHHSIRRVNLIKENQRIEITGAINHKEVTLYGQEYKYTITAENFDKPHHAMRKTFREKFFSSTGFSANNFCTTSKYSPSSDDGSVDVTYFVGVEDLTSVNPVFENCKCITVNIVNAQAFKCSDNFLNPYDVIIDIHFRFMAQHTIAWSCDWDFERFSWDDDKNVTYEYIIPVRNIPSAQEIVDTFKPKANL